MNHRMSPKLNDLAAEVLERRAASLATVEQAEVVHDRASLLAFRLGDEWYAVPIEHVREIYNEFELTPIPCVPPHVKGVINIRGEIISVTDLAVLMGVSHSEDVDHSSAIVVQNEGCATAMVVDAISDIVDVEVDSIEPPIAAADKGLAAEFVTGSAFIDGRLVALINAEKVLEPIGASN